MNFNVKKHYKASLVLYFLSIIFFLEQYSITSIFEIGLLAVCSYVYHLKSKPLGKYTRILFITIFLGTLYVELGSLWSLEAGVSLLSFSALLKTFELKHRRDLFIFSLIIQLSLIGHLLNVDDLYMILILILIMINLFWLLFKNQCFEKNDDENKEVYLYRRRVFVHIVLMSIGLALGLFFIFPRFTLGNLFFKTGKGSNVAGFSEDLRPGEIDKIIQSERTYFRAHFKNDRPEASKLYWRGMALAKTDGFNWKRAPVGRSKYGKKRKTNPEETIEDRVLNYEVDYDFLSPSAMFLLENNLDYDIESRAQVVGMGGGTFFIIPYRNEKIKYRAYAGKIKNKDREQSLTKGQRRIYLSLPSKIKNIKFDQWINKHRNKYKEEQKVINFLRLYIQSNNFKYSLKPGKMNSYSPLDDFFFNRKVGLCEHYASALAFALRKFNIPSRVIVGFQGAQYNSYGRYYKVEGRNAHSWVEYWSDSYGWQRLDPTSWVFPRRLELGADAYFSLDKNLESLAISQSTEMNGLQFLKEASLLFDMLYFELNRAFLSYDFEKQGELFNFLELKGRFKYLKLLGLVFFLIILALTSVIVIIFWKQNDKISPKDELLKILEKRLAKRGIRILSWWGPKRIEEEVSKYEISKKEKIIHICRWIEKLCYQNSFESNIDQRKEGFKLLKKEIKKI